MPVSRRTYPLWVILFVSKRRLKFLTTLPSPVIQMSNHRQGFASAPDAHLPPAHHCQPFDIKTIKVREIILTGVIRTLTSALTCGLTASLLNVSSGGAVRAFRIHRRHTADTRNFRHHQRTARTCHRKFIARFRCIAQPLATPPS